MKWLTKPTVRKIFGDEEHDDQQYTCQGDSAELNIECLGQEPFVVAYTVFSLEASGKQSLLRKERISSSIRNLQISYSTDQPGYYRYQITGISDFRYKNFCKVEGVAFNINVGSPPIAKLKSSSPPSLTYCKGSTDQVELPIRFSGIFPIKVKFEVKSHVTGRTNVLQQEVAQPHFNLELSMKEYLSGHHTLRILNIMDSNGCGNYSPDQETSFYVADAPNISPLDARSDFCVGESLTFLLDGEAPWTIEYVFNNHRRIATTKSHTFSRVAERPGNFTLLRVADRSKKCSLDVSNIHRIIHPIPSVKMLPSSKAMENIREGSSPSM